MKIKHFPAQYVILTALALTVILLVTFRSQLRGAVRSHTGLSSHGLTSARPAVNSESDVPCQEPPDLIRAKPAPTSKYLPDTKTPGVQTSTQKNENSGESTGSGFSHSNYLKLSDVQAVLVADSHGHSEDPFNERPTGQRLKRVVYDHPSRDSLLITAPVDETYIITFESRGQMLVSLDLVRGEDNEFPDLAVRYTDLHLPEGVRAMLRVTPQGIDPLRLDKNSDGDFETTINPGVVVTAPATYDHYGPTICFGESRRGAATRVTIAAADASGVRTIYYALAAGPPSDGLNFRPYEGPFEVDASRTPLIYALADDRVGNRSGLKEFKVKKQE